MRRAIMRESVHRVPMALFLVLFVSYLLLILADPHLGPSDEFAFLATLQSGKPFPFYNTHFLYYDSFSLGRFSPLAGQEYNLVSFFSNTPFAYFLWNAVELLLFTVIFFRILRLLNVSFTSGRWILILLLVTPGFTLTFTKLLYIEKTVLVLFSAVILACIEVSRCNWRLAYFIVGLVCANVAMYYKETAFIAIGAFGATCLVFTWKKGGWWLRAVNTALVISAVIYVLAYLILVLPHHGKTLYTPGWIAGSGLVFAKNFANYALFTDPIIVLILLPLTLYRAWRIFFRGQRPELWPDAMLAAGTAYAIAFFILDMYSPYYLLPAYIFGVPPLLYFYMRKEPSQRFWLVLLPPVVFVLIVNSFPLGVHYLTYNKYVHRNFTQTIAFLARDIPKSRANHRVAIFLDGVDQGTGLWAYYTYGEYLKFAGLPIRAFDFKSDMVTPNGAPAFFGKRSPFDTDTEIDSVDPNHVYVNRNFPFSVFQPGPPSKPLPGDYLVVSPQSVRNIDKRFLETLSKEYDLVFHTESPFAVPRVTLKTAVKYVLMQGLQMRSNVGFITNDNLLNWPDYYVFIKR